jgi:phospholipase/lecithinase/hemolysin
MRSAVTLAILLLAAPFVATPASANGSPDMTISMLDRFHLSHEQVYFTVVADNLTTGSLLELRWILHDGDLATGTEILNGSMVRTATGDSKSLSFQMSQFYTGNNWYTVAIELYQDGNLVDSDSHHFSVFSNVDEPQFSQMVIFGDSLSDMGNVKDSIMNMPAVPPYWQGRFSNGPVWAEYVAAELGLSLQHGTGSGEGNNRAYGGSQTGQGYSYILLPNTGTQINNYLANVHSSFNSTDLVVIWSGGNDFLYGLADANTTHANMVSHVEAVIQAGAKNILLPNLPPLELTPEVRNKSSNQQQQIAASISSYNSALAYSMPTLASTHGVDIMLVDTHSMFYDFMHNSTYLGLTNLVDMACQSSGSILPLPICNSGDPVVSNVDEYVFFDKAHPTAAMHELISIQAMLAIGDKDADDDGVIDDFDTCPWTDAGRIANETGCSIEQQDDDADGVQNSLDDCPQTPAGSTVDENGCSAAQRDSDNDGFSDDIDPCPYSPTGGDHDNDGCTNPEDEDDDNDGVQDVDDECPTGAVGWTSLPQVDIDGDGCRDVDEDEDDDGDGLSDAEEYQKGTDQTLWDTDGDGINDKDDPFPLDSTQWEDYDGDGYGDNPLGNIPDYFPADSTQWSDSDGDGFGDNPDGMNPDHFVNDGTQWNDSDGDGYGDNPDGFAADACPDVIGTSSVPPGCPDSDADGYANDYDAFPMNINQWNDSDGDGYGNNPGFQNSDDFPDDPSEWNDTDGDGYGDNAADKFPDDPLEWNDTDGDGCGDNSDVFPEDPSECLDYDEDGVGDNADAFRRDPAEWEDSDGDGVGDNADALPNDPRDWQDSDGDGIGDSMESSTSENFDVLSGEIILAGAVIVIILAALILTGKRKKPGVIDPSELWFPDEGN